MADGVPTHVDSTDAADQAARPATLVSAANLALTLTPRTSPNGIRYASAGETNVRREDLERILKAVPASVAAAIATHVFYFVPLALPEGRRPDPSDDGHAGQTLVSTIYEAGLAEEAICHRNVSLPATDANPAHEGVFLSVRLLRDQFSLAFEFFINVGHLFAAAAGMPAEFEQLAWSQAQTNVRGESSQDAWESRNRALGATPERGASEHATTAIAAAADAVDERAKSDFLLTAFAEALAIYQLSLAVDFDYAELREREYPLLAPAALAERLRLMAKLFPPNADYEFSIRYRRR
jgi:hypothetical protein